MNDDVMRQVVAEHPVYDANETPGHSAIWKCATCVDRARSGWLDYSIMQDYPCQTLRLLGVVATASPTP